MPRNLFPRVCRAAAALAAVHYLCAVVPAQNPVDPAKVSVVYRVAGMERAVVRKGVVFDDTAGRPLALDAYLPRGARAGSRLPAVVFVSGAEQVREWQWFVTWGQLAAAHGIVGIVPDKRYPRGLGGIRSGFEDTEKLLAYLRADGGRLGVDPERVCLWTFSAGGRLTSVGLRAAAPGVRCLVSFYGVLDLSGEFASVGDERERDSLLRRYSPLHVLESTAGAGGRVPPLLLARAGRDAPFLNAGIDRFAAAALRLNAPLTVLNYPEGDHGFDGVNDTPQSRALMRAALQFVLENTAAR